MTEAAPKTTSLTGEEFKTLALTNVAQLQNWLQSIPPHLESGASGLTADHIALIEAHMNRGLMFLRSWSLTKVAAAPLQPSAQPEQQGNGAAPLKKGGWPKGRKRTPKQPAASQ